MAIKETMTDGSKRSYHPDFIGSLYQTPTLDKFRNENILQVCFVPACFPTAKVHIEMA